MFWQVSQYVYILIFLVLKCVKYPTEIKRVEKKVTHHGTVYHHGKYHKIAHNYGKLNISEPIKLTAFFPHAIIKKEKEKKKRTWVVNYWITVVI